MTTRYNVVIDDLIDQARKADKQFKDNLSILTGRDDLNAKGMSDSRKMFVELYQNATGALKGQAEDRVKAGHVYLAKKRAEVRKKEVEAKRALLGDQVFARIVERRLEGMTSEHIRRAFEEAAEGFEKTLIGEMGYTILRERKASDPTPDNVMALQTLEDAILAASSPELQDLDRLENEIGRAEGLIPQLDPVTWRAEMGDRFGVRPGLVQTEWEEEARP